MEVTPGITTAKAVQTLIADITATLHDDELIHTVRTDEHLRRRLDAEAAVKLVELSRRATEGHHGFTQAATAEIGLLMGISTRAAQHRIDTATTIVSRPQVWHAWHQGLLDRTQAQKIVHMLADVPDPKRFHLEAIAIGYAHHNTTSALHKKLLALTCDHDPDELMRRQALDKRGVDLIHGPHGMSTVIIHTTAEQAHAFHQTLTARAQRPDVPDPHQQGDQRTLDHKRADVLTGFLDDHCLYNIDVNVLIPADMLIGVETKGANLNGSPCTRALAVHLAWSPDARWTRLVTDPLTGILIDAGRTKYRIPKHLRDAIRLRDLTCRFPMCDRKAEYCDTDHVTPHRISGKTEPSDLTPGCRTHHRAKTHGQWTLTTTTTHAQQTTWTGVLGHSYTTTPPDQYRRD